MTDEPQELTPAGEPGPEDAPKPESDELVAVNDAIPTAAEASPESPSASGSGETAATAGQGGDLTDDDQPYNPGPIPTDAHRIPADIPRELFGSRFDRSMLTPRPHVRNDGQANIGDHGTINNHYSAPQEKAVLQHLAHVRELTTKYAGTRSDEHLRELLRERPVVGLHGRAGTGRFTTACFALARRCGTESVYEILPPTGDTLMWIPAMKEEIRRGAGYILRLPGLSDIRTLRQMKAVMVEAEASLIVIRSTTTGHSAPTTGEVEHCRPDPVAVFRVHLSEVRRAATKQERHDVAAFVARCCEWPEVRNVLAKTYSPGDAAQLAEKFAHAGPGSAEQAQPILEGAGAKLRERAVRALVPQPRGDGHIAHRPGQHERAFRIAYAAFCRQPLNDVFISAGWLLEAIDDHSRRPDLGRLALAHPVNVLLGDALSEDWHDSLESVPPPGQARLASLRNPDLRGHILDVAWNEFDHTRPALLAWLNRLVSDPASTTTMHHTAGEIAGLLASHDYDRVKADLIDPWAASARMGARHAAARATVVAAASGQVEDRVQETVRGWVASGAKRKHDTALRTYTQGLHLPDPEWHIADLRRVSPDRLQQNSDLVAEAINQLYLPNDLPWLVGRLAAWIRSPAKGDARLGHAHAASAFLRLAAREAPGSPAGEMQRQLGRAEIDVSDVATLFQYALLDNRSARQGWDQFGEWLTQADRDEELRKGTATLISELASVPPMRRRLSYFLGRSWTARHHVPDWIIAAMGAS